MNGKEFKYNIELAGLTHQQAADKLQVGKATLYRWFAMDTLPPKILRTISDSLPELTNNLILKRDEKEDLRHEIDKIKLELALLKKEFELLSFKVGQPLKTENSLDAFGRMIDELQALRKEFESKKTDQ